MKRKKRVIRLFATNLSKSLISRPNKIRVCLININTVKLSKKYFEDN